MPVASVALKTMSLPEFGEPTVMPLVERPPRGPHSGISPAVLAFTQQCDGRRKALITFRPEMTYFRRT
ncbi:hypothetical protein [Mesorhizobium sp. Mes31]|uniref:hypothetical protein n=1 Tax=Mesorhizobium sp. Mes31 TaxID=2926017 RepID=UPI0021176B1C|nr:hypothetical protein [Mesorhizobium sp. Mes31]